MRLSGRDDDMTRAYLDGLRVLLPEWRVAPCADIVAQPRTSPHHSDTARTSPHHTNQATSHSTSRPTYKHYAGDMTPTLHLGGGSHMTTTIQTHIHTYIHTHPPTHPPTQEDVSDDPHAPVVHLGAVELALQDLGRRVPEAGVCVCARA
jgi:hypothetical protein